MHIRLLAAIVARSAGFALAVSLLLSGCSALRGEPDFPTSALLPGDAAKLLPAPLSTVGPVAVAPPVLADCQKAIAWEDAVTPKPFLLIDYQNFRNHCIFSFISAIDLQYNDYKRQIVNESGYSNAAADITVLGLTTAGAAVGAKDTKTILSGVAALITGTKTSIDKDVLYNNSILAVAAKMDADRAQQFGVILQRVQADTLVPTTSAAGVALPAAAATKLTSTKVIKDVTVQQPATAVSPASTTTTHTQTTTGAAAAAPPARGAQPAAGQPAPAMPGGANAPAGLAPAGTGNPLPYSMYQAAVDVVAYYEAGTFPHALVSLQETAGSQAASCKAQVNSLKTTGQKAPSTDTDPTTGTTPNTTNQPTPC